MRYTYKRYIIGCGVLLFFVMLICITVQGKRKHSVASDPDDIVIAIMENHRSNEEMMSIITTFGLMDGYSRAANLTFLSACAASSSKRFMLANWLISNGANPNPERGQLPLVLATLNCDVELVTALLEAGARWDIKTSSGKTVLSEVRSSFGFHKIGERHPHLVPEQAVELSSEPR